MNVYFSGCYWCRETPIVTPFNSDQEFYIFLFQNGSSFKTKYFSSSIIRIHFDRYFRIQDVKYLDFEKEIFRFVQIKDKIVYEDKLILDVEVEIDKNAFMMEFQEELSEAPSFFNNGRYVLFEQLNEPLKAKLIFQVKRNYYVPNFVFLGMLFGDIEFKDIVFYYSSADRIIFKMKGKNPWIDVKDDIFLVLRKDYFSVFVGILDSDRFKNWFSLKPIPDSNEETVIRNIAQSLSKGSVDSLTNESFSSLDFEQLVKIRNLSSKGIQSKKYFIYTSKLEERTY